MDPDLVGNTQRVLVSDLAGRSNILYKAAKFGIDLESNKPAIAALLQELKELESKRFAFEGAEASFELLMRKAIDGDRVRFYRLIGFRVIDEKRTESEPPIAEATIMLEGPTAGSSTRRRRGNGPVNALDRALRKASGSSTRGRAGAAPRLQGAGARQPGGHRGRRARADRVRRRARALGDGRRLAQRDRGELAGPGRQHGLQALQGAPRAHRRRRAAESAHTG
jgi:hypothetical protein